MAAVTGPTSSTDTAIARWNGTTGTVIQDSTVTLDGSGNLTGVASLAGSVTTTTQSQADNSTKIATTAYVRTGLANIALDNLTDCATNGFGSLAVGVASVGIKSHCTIVGLTAGGTGGSNTAVGFQCMDVVSGSSNTAVGYGVMSSSGGPNQNVAIGEFALLDLTTGGDGNVAVGYHAGETLTTGTNNIYIGHNVDVLSTATDSNTINIGNVFTATGINTPSTSQVDLPGTLVVTGTITGISTTQSPGDNSTKLATTAYVDTAVSTTTALTNGDIFVGNASNVATGVAMSGDVTITNTGVTSIKSSVALAGSPTTTTQTAGDNSTKIATTAYVDAAVSAGSAAAPTFQYLTTGSGATYTTPAGCKALHIEMVGGGGGGGAAGTNNGSAGGDSIFNSVHAKGGSGGTHGPNGLGGAGGTGGTGSATYRQAGQTGFTGYTASGGNSSGAGGSSLMGFGAPPLLTTSTAGVAATANSGSGGSGGWGTSTNFGGGGGGGEYLVLDISSPTSTYTYTVGSGGSGGAAGTFAGGNAGSGFIRVTEYS